MLRECGFLLFFDIVKGAPACIMVSQIIYVLVTFPIYILFRKKII